jgi:hypothetical protein
MLENVAQNRSIEIIFRINDGNGIRVNGKAPKKPEYFQSSLPFLGCWVERKLDYASHGGRVGITVQRPRYGKLSHFKKVHVYLSYFPELVPSMKKEKHV